MRFPMIAHGGDALLTIIIVLFLVTYLLAGTALWLAHSRRHKAALSVGIFAAFLSGTLVNGNGFTLHLGAAASWGALGLAVFALVEAIRKPPGAG